MIIHLKVSGGVTFSLDVEEKLSISEVKLLAAEQAKVIAPQQRIFHKGKILQDEDTLENVAAGSTLFLVRGAEKGKDGSSTDDAAGKEEEAKDAAPVLCAGNCGFFGNPKTNNLCSKCFGIQQKKDQEELRKKTERIKEPKKAEAETPKTAEAGAAAADGSKTPVGVPEVSGGGSSSDAPTNPGEASGEAGATTAGEASEESPAPVERPVQEKKTRCWMCNKKIGLAGFDCRCGYIFCGNCRHAEEHNCDFDFKTSGREILRKQNVKVVADKLDKA